MILTCALTSFGERESVEQGVCFSVCNPWSSGGVHHFSNVSANVERVTHPKMAAGSWQGWQSWAASSSSCDEGEWDTKWQEVESEVKGFTRVERSEGILDV